MKSPITHMKQTASFRIVSSMLTITPLWLMLATANTSPHAQTSNPSPADPYETVLGVGNVGSLQLKWKNPIRGGGSFLGAAVANGMIYFWSLDGNFLDGNVYALNASTGAKLWSYATGGGSPTIANGVVYIVSKVGTAYALNATTGAKLWSSDVGRPDASPAVANGVVYVSSLISGLYALNASTGATLWSFDALGSVMTNPAVANGVVYFGTDINSVYALNASTGAMLWSSDTENIVFSTPEVANGVVYVSSGTMYALNASTGAKLWTTGGCCSSLGVDVPSAVANGVVYAGASDGNLYALNASTGAKLWSFAGVGFASAVANGVVYGSGGSNLYALNASTGAVLWSFAGVGFASASAVANGVVYGSGGSNLYASNASTGAKLWSFDTGAAVDGSPAIVNGMVYVHTGGNVYAFSVGADLFLRIIPSATTVHQGDLLTFAFPVWNLGPANAVHEVLNTQVPAGTTFNYIRISGTPGLGTCTHPAFQGTGQIVCHENSSMAPNTTWTVRLTVKVTATSGTKITESAATMADTLDPNLANNTATVSIKVQ
jgi:outer membrane protein assembly factor BamB